MNLVNAGDLRHTITLQSRAAGRSSLGQASGAWADAVTVRASVEPLRGRELFAAGSMVNPVDTRVRIRYRSGVTAAMRFVWEGVPYGITSVVDVGGLHHTLELMGTSKLRDTQ